MRRTIIIAAIATLLLLLTACASTTVGEIVEDPDKYVGKKVVVTGEVIMPIKLGKLSGFTLREGKDNIIVASDTIPDEREKVTIKGTVVEGVLMPHYIYADKLTVEK